VKVTRCRVCLGRELVPILDLGRTALANRFLAPGQLGDPEPYYPLRLVLCPACGLVQIDEEVPREDLFYHYLYVSGTSDLIHRHAAALARDLAGACPLGRGDLVVEAASNDGTVLEAFRRRGARVVGVEPAQNVAARAREAGIDTLCAYFDADSARQVRGRHGPARLVLARHVLAHVSDLHGFVEGLRLALAPDGLVAVESPHLLPFHQRLEYDTVYHEHLCYWSVRVLRTLFARSGLEVVDARQVAIHGGSVLVLAQHAGGARRVSPAVGYLIEREERAGLHRPGPWRQFARRVARSRDALRGEIDRLRREGARLAGYGAPAKGMTLLAWCGLGPEEVPYLVDRSPHKQGLLTPGHHIPIQAPARLLEDRPDVALLLAWNFADEVVRQQGEYLRGGGRFLIPIPLAYYHGGATPVRLAA
jgi:novobiocin biosynthesis protein NovU/D-mycarose 3-C-methyltransferase